MSLWGETLETRFEAIFRNSFKLCLQIYYISIGTYAYVPMASGFIKR